MGISNFWISGQSLIEGNCYNSRTSDAIDMKLGPVAKLDTRNKTTSKTFDHDFMSQNCEVVALFPIYGQFGTILKLDSRSIVCKTYVFIMYSTFYLTKNEKRSKKSLTQLSHYCFSKGTILAKKHCFFCKIHQQN